MKKWIKILAGIIALLLVLFLVDYFRIKSDKPPLIAIETARYKDGGSRIFMGLGYKIFAWNKLGEKQIDGKMTRGIYKGYEISFPGSFKTIDDGPGEEIDFIPDSSFQQ